MDILTNATYVHNHNKFFIITTCTGCKQSCGGFLNNINSKMCGKIAYTLYIDTTFNVQSNISDENVGKFFENF